MQKEIKRRAKLYGIAAVLLATILISLCYQLGYIPQIPLPQPSPQSIPSMLTFSSYEELKDFLKNRTQNPLTYSYNGAFATPMSPNLGITGITVNSPAIPAEKATAPQYSTTNIQVAGVDEADTVKNDGEYLYLLMGNNVSILKAYPATEAKLVSTIVVSDMTPVGIFVNRDRLAVLGTKYNLNVTPYYGAPYDSYIAPYLMDVTTYVKVYDISDRTHPEPLTTFSTSGNYISSRMIGQYVYLVASQPAYYVVQASPNVTIDKVNIPMLGINGNMAEASPSEIYYSNTSDGYFMFTTVVTLNIQNTTESPSYKTLTLGGTSTMYVSLNNIYITFPIEDHTLIYRLHVENSTINPEAQGEVPGSVLNQYSMDEYNDYFRIATTTWITSPMNATGPLPATNVTGILPGPIKLPSATNVAPTLPPTNGTTPLSTPIMTSGNPIVMLSWAAEHNVYVLSMNLTIVGRLENLAPDENLHSARFVGNRCYLVTFQKTDPLFVINLTDATEPAVLGQLSIPGYSDYLHPYDENHLIGVGKETVEAEQGYFAWYQGIKVALFDVSNVSNPIQMANYTIGDRGSNSPVLSDPKAFLFDKSKNLLVIPVLVARVDQSQYPSGEIPPSAYGQPVWQGAYVFNLTLSEGFVFRGGITHIEDGTSIWDSNYYVQRSLYIENVLYTVSNAKVKLNSLDDLAFIKEIEIG